MDTKTSKRRRESTGAHEDKPAASRSRKRRCDDEEKEGRPGEANVTTEQVAVLKPDEAKCETSEYQKVPSGSAEHQSSQYQHAFETNVLDHCETPRAAYEHLREFLEVLGEAMKMPTTSIHIWDPYYCDGSVKRIFTELGFTNMIHENVDFYQLIATKCIPSHDVLVTNPPYSEDHIHRLLDFVVRTEIPNQRPVCLLLPNWVSRQPDYEERFVKPVAQTKNDLFYLSPLEPYTYSMPSWVHQKDRPEHVGSNGKTTPYLSSWYLVTPSSTSRNSILERMDAVEKLHKPKAWVVAKTVKGLKWKIKKVKQSGAGNRGGKATRPGYGIQK
jgi:hypothetical protein